MTPPTKRRLTAVQMIFGLRKRIVKLERELNGAMHARTEDVRRSVMAGMQQFEEEHRARDIASLVHKEIGRAHV